MNSVDISSYYQNILILKILHNFSKIWGLMNFWGLKVTNKVLLTGSKPYFTYVYVIKVWWLEHLYGRSYHNLNFVGILPEMQGFLRGSPGSNYNVGVVIGIALTFERSVAKWLKWKVRTCWKLMPTFIELKRKRIIGGLCDPLP